MSSLCETEARLVLDRSIAALRGLPGARSAPDAVAQQIVSCLARDDISAARALLPRSAADDTLASAVVAAARQAERLWKQGLLGFDAAVAVFAGLEQILRDPVPRPAVPTHAPRLLLAVAEGEQHRLGPRIAGLRLAEAGIALRTESGIGTEALLDLVAAGQADAVGLSVGSDTGLDGLAETVARLRRAAPDPSMPVILGGAAITLPAAAYAFAGADLVTNDTTAAAAFLTATILHRGRVN